jgi:putative oxidoreductase
LPGLELGYFEWVTERLETRIDTYAPTVLSLFRIFFGLLFLCHGTSKLFGWPAATVAPTGSLFWFAGLIEVITGVLITIGLFTRPAALIASGTMFVAYLMQHLPKGFWPINNGGELAVLYCWAFVLLVFTGPGVWAVDTRAGLGREVYVRGHVRRSPRRWRSRY